MRWSERQLAMLGEMGFRWWSRSGQGGASADVAGAVGEADALAPSAPPALTASSSPAVALPSRPAPAAARVAESLSAPVAGPRPSTAELDWPALLEAVSTCTACALCQGRRQAVLGVGNSRAHWMIVGEAPGEQEDLQGEPFVGKSGQLLDNMLRAIGLTRAEAEPAKQVYIANSVKCRPPGNRNPEPDELARCEPFLVRQLELIRPRLIVAMGRFAVQSLLRSSEPIGRLRGRVHRYRDVPLIVTYHPAYLLRNPEDKAKSWDDLCLAVETLRSLPTPV